MELAREEVDRDIPTASGEKSLVNPSGELSAMAFAICIW